MKKFFVLDCLLVTFTDKLTTLSLTFSMATILDAGKQFCLIKLNKALAQLIGSERKGLMFNSSSSESSVNELNFWSIMSSFYFSTRAPVASHQNKAFLHCVLCHSKKTYDIPNPEV